jgi:hypothetical protein
LYVYITSGYLALHKQLRNFSRVKGSLRGNDFPLCTFDYEENLQTFDVVSGIREQIIYKSNPISLSQKRENIYENEVYNK